MRLHVFQHVSFEGPAEIARWARERGHTFSVTEWFAGASAPHLDLIDGLIVMGGPMNIYEHRAYPWLVEEKKFLAHAIAHGRPVVGVCLGAQLLADVLGGKVYQNPVREIGWWPIRWRDTARSAPGWDFLPRPLRRSTGMATLLASRRTPSGWRRPAIALTKPLPGAAKPSACNSISKSTLTHSAH